MEVKKKISYSNTPDFFSKEMIITKKSLNENQLKYTYQKQLISDLDYKHKEWSKFVKNNIKILRLKPFESYKKNRRITYMKDKKKISSSNTPDFFSKKMIITKKSLNENQLKFTYQKQLISDLDYKHKEWSKSFDSNS